MLGSDRLGVARLVKPEWGVPSALLYTGSGESESCSIDGPCMLMSCVGAMAAVFATVLTSPADCVKVCRSHLPDEVPADGIVDADAGEPGRTSEYTKSCNRDLRSYCALLVPYYNADLEAGPWSVRLFLRLTPSRLTEGRFKRHRLDSV